MKNKREINKQKKTKKQEDHDGPISLTCEQTALQTYCWSFSQVHCSKIFV